MFFGPKMMAGAAGPDVSKLFKTRLYTGNGSAQDVTSVGFQPDLVWVKARDAAQGHILVDSVRGAGKLLQSQVSDGEYNNPASVSAFLADGFSVGGEGNLNSNGTSYGSWCFKRAARFFDIVTWTGDGVDNRDIPHALGVTPALAIIKCRSSARRWVVRTSSWRLVLNDITGAYDLSPPGTQDGYAEISASSPTMLRLKQGSTMADVNASGSTYLGLLFADDSSPDGCVRVVEYTGNGSSDGPVINLGFTPQFLVIRRITGTGNWWMLDTARGMDTTTDPMQRANTASADFTGYGDVVERTSTGFKLKTSDTNLNASGEPYLVLAIRAPAA